MKEPKVKAPVEEAVTRRPALIIGGIFLLSVIAYTTLVMVGGEALRRAPFAGAILSLREGFANLSSAEPPRSLSELPPLSVDTSPTATPSPITVRTTPVPTPSPSLSPRVVPPEPNSPSVVTFNIEFENTTGARLTGVRITDQIPSGTTFRSATPSASFDGDTLVWDLGTLEPGQSGRVSFQVVTRLKGRITNRATMTSNEAPPATIENSATVD